MPPFRSQVIILRSYDFSEADRVLVVYARQYGKIRAVAKGVRRQHSRLAGCLGLLSLTELQFHGKAQQELYLITQGQLITAFSRIKSNLEYLGRAARMCELVERMTPEQETAPELFDLLKEGLELLEAGVDGDVAGLWFEVTFLDRMGYRPVFASCLECGKSELQMAFVPERGGVVCRVCHQQGQIWISAGARNQLEKMLTTKALKVRRIRLLPKIAREMQAAMDAAIYYQLGNELRSDKFRNAVKNLDRIG